MPCLPPLPSLIPVVAFAEAARDGGDDSEFEEVAMGPAEAVTTTLQGGMRPHRAPRRSEERRITDALRRIERQPHEQISLVQRARDAAMSPYHFLRTFRAVVGMTPHQFVLRTRLNQATVSLRRTSDSVSTIAFDAGFNDLSMFNRRFRRIIGLSPSAYRSRWRTTLR